ncbi:MAG: hypothetical protein ACI89J_002352 [Hyphomicrobiaceae bacterium]|jgi:hypothetical protein
MFEIHDRLTATDHAFFAHIPLSGELYGLLVSDSLVSVHCTIWTQDYGANGDTIRSSGQFPLLLTLNVPEKRF